MAKDFPGARDGNDIAAGIFFVAPDGHVLVLKRSAVEENYAGHWGLPGGKAEEGEDAEAAARRESAEEIGRSGSGPMVRIDRRSTPNGMTFHTFLSPVPEKFEPVLNEEHDAFRWAPVDQLPEPIHPGVAATIAKISGGGSPDARRGMRATFARWAQENEANVKHAQDADWEENKHPRRKDGKFGSGGGGAKAPAQKTEAPKEKSEPGAGGAKAAPASKSPAAALYDEHQPTPMSAAQRSATAERIAEKDGATKRIAEARKKLENVVPTDAPVSEGGFVQEDGTYTPERTKIHAQLLGEIFTGEAVARARPAEGEKPTMTILGGRGGSGKSWLTGEHGPVDASKTIVIDADHFKSRLPGYEGWNAAQFHEESSYLVDKAAQMAREAGLNVVFDATLKSSKSALGRIGEFASADYDIDGFSMFASPETATERAMNRFMRGGETGRFVPPEVIMANTDNERNFDAVIPMFKRWGVYDNNSGSGPRHVAGPDESSGRDAAMDAQMRKDRIALDRASMRRTDEDGHMHVAMTPISKANVCPYYGREIPDFQELGLDPDKIYRLLRHPQELKKAAETFAGKPLLMDHTPVSADDHPRQRTVGSVGNEVVWKPPYLMAPLSIWDSEAIHGIQNDTQKELSSAYRYDPDMTPGTHDGEPYDGVMRNIRGNHVALVKEGRAGHDVVVGDAAMKRNWKTLFALDESAEEKDRARGKFSERDKAAASRHVQHRDDMPESAFLKPSGRKYPVKEKKDGVWKYDRDLLLAAARDARMHGDDSLAARADAIRKREFGTAQDTAKESQMAKKPLMSRKAALVQGAVMAFLAPKLAQDAQVDLAPALKGVTSKNFIDRRESIVDRLTKITAGKLAADADLDDLTDLLDALQDVEPAEDDLDPNSGTPAAAAPRGEAEDDDPEDPDVKAKIRELIGDRLSDEELAAMDDLLDGMGAKAMDDDPDGAAAGAADDDEEEKVDKKAMDAAIASAVKANNERRDAIDVARDEVRPFVGKVAVACDSAEDVYRHALSAMNIDVAGVHPSAFRSILKAQPVPGKNPAPSITMDAKRAEDFAARFPHAARVQHA